MPIKKKKTVTIPIEDIGVIILDAYQLTISQKLISELLNNNVALVTCDEKHMPQGLLLNLDGNNIQQERFQNQIKASLPLKKQLWQQTIKAKISNQRALLVKLHYHTNKLTNNKFENMEYWADSVRSGDTGNIEAKAAAFYWKVIFGEYIPNFVRDRYGDDPNNLLNYGYAILRAITARSLVASGLLPTLGIHHHNKYNAYALADDIMEPYRPFVDNLIFKIVKENYNEKNLIQEFQLTKQIKEILLKIPVLDVIIENKKSPLMIAMQRTTASLYNCFAGESRKILYPVLSG